MRTRITTVGLAFILAATLVGGVVGVGHAVDGVVLIDQARALAGGVTPGDAPGFPVTLSHSGSYRLSGNLTVPDENTTAIEITADHVTLDLNGFAILGPSVCVGTPVTSCSPIGTGNGVDAVSGAGVRINTRVVNGTIHGMGSSAIFAGFNSRIERMNITSNGLGGITTLGGLVTESLVRANGGVGIFLSGAIVRNSRASFNNGPGISASLVSVIESNFSAGNSGLGLDLGPFARYTNNSLEGNNGGGVQVSGGSQAGANTCNGAPCP